MPDNVQEAIAAFTGIAEDGANKERLWSWLCDLRDSGDRVRRNEAGFDKFDKWLDMYYGKHWPDVLPSFRPPVVINELRSLILSEANDLSESDFRVYVMKDPSSGGRDEEAERAMRAIWAREQIPLKLTYAMCWALIVGTGFMRVQWDPDAFHGMGDVVVSDVDPRYVIPDPDAIDDKRWSYVIVESYMDIGEIRRMFPLTGGKVRPEDRWSDRAGRGSMNPDNISWARYSGPMSNSGTLVGAGVEGYKKARARVIDCLVLDPTTETTIEEAGVDETGNKKYRESTVAKYPKGRRIVGANGEILFDGPNPNPASTLSGTPDFGVLRVILEPALGKFWSQGFVQQTMELQLAADKLMSAVVENAIRLNNGIIKATTNTGLDWESFAGMPGQIVQINQGSTFEIMYPDPMPADMIQAPWRMLDMQKRLLGFEGSRGGAQSRGNTSAELTETEISQAQGPTRLRGRMLYYMVQRLAEMIFARMAANYLTPRVIPAVEGERYKPVVWKPLEDPTKYSVYVDPTAFQIMSRTMLKRVGLALFKLRAIDRENLLETIGWPDWEKTAERLSKADQLAAWAKANSGRRR